jgi:hypothetical protein
MPNKALPEHFEDLDRVVTLAEAARLVYRHPNIVRYAIDTGNVAAVKSGRIWLVSVRSLHENFPE